MHYLKNGKPCGKKDGHKGNHLSVEALERQREHMREYRATQEYREYQREWQRNRRANDPEYRERQREISRECKRNYSAAHPLYKTWDGIRQRCLNPNADNYSNYGGRGITIYLEWIDDFTAFETWINENLGPKPSPEYSLDRRDNDGNYEPGNLRWATRREQSLNTRSTTRFPHINISKYASRYRTGIAIDLGSFEFREDAEAFTEKAYDEWSNTIDEIIRWAEGMKS